MPSSFAEGDSEDDGPYLHELLEQKERERAVKEAGAEFAAQNAEETDARIPTVDLEPLTVTLSPPGGMLPFS